MFLFDYSDTRTVALGSVQLGVNVVCFLVGFLLQSQMLGQGIVGFGLGHRTQLAMLVISFSFLLIMDQLYAGEAGYPYLLQVRGFDAAVDSVVVVVVVVVLVSVACGCVPCAFVLLVGRVQPSPSYMQCRSYP
jgi:hypothetical protein